jgi:hypothetical protein
VRIRRVAAYVLGALCLLVACAAAFAYWYDRTGQQPDRTFDSRVAQPAYATEHPVVAFDVAHRNWHTPTGRYRPLAELLEHDGYQVREHRTPFTADALAGTRVLVIANAAGANGHEGAPAFSDDETATIHHWVEQGGSLLLIADHVPFGAAAAKLAAAFGVTMHLAFARDDRFSGWDNERLLFRRADHMLGAHPILQGRTPADRVDVVETFTGQSLSGPSGSALLPMSDESYDWKSRQERSSAKGHAQGVALQVGQGRVVVLGEAGMLSAQVDPLGVKMGMNRPGNDDRQFALNIMHWLSGGL